LSGLVEVAAVAWRSGDRARRFAAKHNIARAYGSYETLLGDTGIDALYIAFPPGLHAHWFEMGISLS
jgi:predicted dehydrogenase